jgi:3(or 17)beta-hydroxysteroid dehydrogenase
MIPLKRRGTPEEMARAMVYFASDDSRYCIGSEIMLDGGLTQVAH